MEAGGGDVALAVLDGMVDPVVVVSPSAELVYSNRAAVDRFGWTAEQIGGSLTCVLHPDDLRTSLQSFAAVQREEAKGSPVAVRLLDSTGDYSWFEVRGRALPPGSTLDGVVLSCRELTDRGRWEVGGGQVAALGAILDAIPTLAMVVDAEGRVRSGNRAITRLLGRSLEDTIGHDLTDLVVDHDRARLRLALRAAPGASIPVQLEVGLLADVGVVAGSTVPASITILDLLSDRAVRGLVVTATDIASLVAARTDLEHLASHDDLTGLPNRAALREHLETAVRLHPATEVTLVFGDVDGLKQVNDRFGHRAGDALLRELARRLRAAVPTDDLVARLSGDEFVVVLHTLDPAAVTAARSRIERSLEASVELPSGDRVRASMSLGVARSSGAVDVDELLSAADAAMYVAKREMQVAPLHG